MKGKGAVGHGAVPRNVHAGNNVSFKEVLTGELAEAKSIVLEDNFVENEDLLGCALVVRLKNVDDLRNIRVILKEMRIPGGAVSYLGGMAVLIKFNCKEHAVMAKDELEGKKDEFDLIELWEGQDIKYERIAWLKIYGIPLQVMSNKVLDDIGSLYGYIVKSAQHEKDDVDVSFHYVGVLVNDGKRIQDVVTLKWRGKLFKAWIHEKSGDWIPYFVAPSSGEEVQEKPAEGYVGSPETVEEIQKSPVSLQKETVNNYGENFEHSIEMNENGNIPFIENMGHLLFKFGKGGQETFLSSGMENFDSQLKKRKKSRKPRKSKNECCNIGRPNTEVCSSEERPMGKRPRHDDPFGLDSIIGIAHSEENQDTPSGSHQVNDLQEPLDLNTQPEEDAQTEEYTAESHNQRSMEDRATVEGVIPDPAQNVST
ncbi:hypothetical protein Hdeb2414_s0026g00676931 [Helianthus debilis subsp. tardiflorus]